MVSAGSLENRVGFVILFCLLMVLCNFCCARVMYSVISTHQFILSCSSILYSIVLGGAVHSLMIYIIICLNINIMNMGHRRYSSFQCLLWRRQWTGASGLCSVFWIGIQPYRL